MATVKLDYFEGLVSLINRKHNLKLSVELRDNEITLNSERGRVFGTIDPTTFESALKSLKKDGIISHYLFEERKDYRTFIEQEKKNGVNPKQAHKKYFESLL